MTYTIGSLCSGYSGLDGAVELALGPARHAWHAELDADAARVLAHHYPHTPNLGDLTAVDWTSIEQVDVLTAGFPCQDVSNAGKRSGLRPGTRTGLWFEVLEAIATLRPSLVVLENVPGLMNGAFEDEPNDRCVCGWPYRRRGVHRGFEEQGGDICRPYRRRDVLEGANSAGTAAAGLRRIDPEQPSRNGPMGVGRVLDGKRDCGCGHAQADCRPSGPEERTGVDCSEGRGNSCRPREDADWSIAMDGRGEEPVCNLEDEDARVESQGACDPATDEWITDCPHCGRAVGDRPGRSVFGSGLGTVLRSLAQIGYVGSWQCVRASDVGAPHRRERVFILARTADPEGVGQWHQRAQGRRGVSAAAVAGGAGRNGLSLLPTPAARPGDDRGTPSVALATDRLASGRRNLEDSVALLPTPTARDYKGTGPADMDRNSPNLSALGALLPTPRATDGTNGGPNQRGSSGDLMLPSAVMELLPTPRTVNSKSSRAMTASTDNGRRSGGGQSSPPGLDEMAQMFAGVYPDHMPAFDLLPPATQDAVHALLSGKAHTDRWGRYTDAIVRWEHATGRPAPDPTEPGTKGQPRLAPRFVEFLMGLPDGWVTAVPGVGRNAQLRILGNGVVPAQGAHALRLLLAQAADSRIGAAA